MEEVADRLRDVDPDAEVSLLFVESDDVYLVMLRLDQGEDLRVFGSDAAFAEESRLGALLLGDIEAPVLEIDDDGRRGADDEGGDEPAVDPTPTPSATPTCSPTSACPPQRLLDLCAHEGMLPGDITAEICQPIGCGDEVEELREA